MRLIFLGCGYLGSNLCNLLQNTTDVSIWGLPSPYAEHVERLEIVDVFATEQLAKMDVRDAIIVDTVAPIASVDRAEREEEALSNLAASYRKMLRVLRNGGAGKLIFFSSGGTVYGSHRQAVDEETPLRPQTLYARSKVLLEQIVAESGLPYVILRLANPYGGYQLNGKRQGVIPILLQKIYTNEVFTLFTTPESVRDYVYITDLAQALRRILDAALDNTVLNVGSGCGKSLAEVIACVETETRKKLRIRQMESAVPQVECNVLSIQKLQRLTGYAPTISLTEGIRREAQRIRKELAL